MPPSARGRRTCASWSVPAGGNPSPLGAGIRPVALDTAAISIADFVPSRNELNIRGFMPPSAARSGEMP